MIRPAPLLVGILLVASTSAQTISIGSKPFTESYVLAEMMAQLITSQTDLTVDRRFGMQGTFTSFSAIRDGEIDIYPEYTGTGALAILKSSERADQSLDSLRAKFERLYDLTWLEPWGFNNSWALVVKPSFARKFDLKTMSDLARAPNVRGAFTHEFMQREDGYPGLVEAYNFNFAEARGIQHVLAYDALAADEIDVMDAYATDGEIARYGLVVLADDRSFFPEYLAAPLIRLETLETYPQLAALLNTFAGAISDDQMQALNHAAALAGNDYSSVVANFISERSYGRIVSRGEALPPIIRQIIRHLMLTGIAVLLATLIAIPLGIIMIGRPTLAKIVLAVTGVMQTIPSIAMLGFMIPILGIGVTPAIAALFIYGLLPITRNTYAGISDVDRHLIEVADGLGMSRGRRLLWLELPLAAPIIFAGIRTAAVIAVGTATLAAFIGAGGLGEPIVQGLSFNDPKMILSGAIPAALLAMLIDTVLGAIEHALTRSASG